MGYTTINLGLSLTIPTSGTRNWTQQLLTGAWEKISEHDHTGGGNGAQLTGASLAPNIGLVQAGVQTVAPSSINASLQTAGETETCTRRSAWTHAHRSAAGSPIRVGWSASRERTRSTLPSTMGVRSPNTMLAMAPAV